MERCGYIMTVGELKQYLSKVDEETDVYIEIEEEDPYYISYVRIEHNLDDDSTTLTLGSV
jgi:hypothetical protein